MSSFFVYTPDPVIIDDITLVSYNSDIFHNGLGKINKNVCNFKTQSQNAKYTINHYMLSIYIKNITTYRTYDVLNW